MNCNGNNDIENKMISSQLYDDKIGILGGTFDPIHNGHLSIAMAAMKEYELSKIYLIPTGISYMKKDVTDSYFRYEMVKLAASDMPGFVPSDVEIKREGNTYTCETIEYFKNKYPDAKLYFIIGTDSLFSLDKWRNIDYILKNCTILCATRPDDNELSNVKHAEKTKVNELSEKYNGEILFVHSEPMDISSTDIRNFRYHNPESDLKKLPLPVKVSEYIIRQDLYDNKTNNIHALLKEDLKPKRWKHTMGVVDMAVRMAQKWGCDLENARIAALLHDCAKYLDIDAKMALCAKYGVGVTDIEKTNPELLHAKAGALLAYEKYGISNREILSAIYYHTTGRPNMSLLEQIIFVADYIEPGRTHSDKLPQYRQLAFDNINILTAKILKDTVKYLDKRAEDALIIDSRTKDALEFYKNYL